MIASTTIGTIDDIRPYMTVEINSLEFQGLLDSGASVSCLGNNCMENANRMNAKFLAYKSSVRTADGKHHLIVGKIKSKIKCGRKSVETILYLVPNLSQEIILAYDFWRKIGLKVCLDDRVIEEITASDPEELTMHQLTSYQNRLLESVKLNFLCYTQHGLGKPIP